MWWVWIYCFVWCLNIYLYIIILYIYNIYIYFTTCFYWPNETFQTITLPKSNFVRLVLFVVFCDVWIFICTYSFVYIFLLFIYLHMSTLTVTYLEKTQDKTTSVFWSHPRTQLWKIWWSIWLIYVIVIFLVFHRYSMLFGSEIYIIYNLTKLELSLVQLSFRFFVYFSISVRCIY